MNRDYPMQTTVDGEEKYDFEDYCFDIIIITMLASIAAVMVCGAFVVVHRVAWGM